MEYLRVYNTPFEQEIESDNIIEKVQHINLPTNDVFSRAQVLRDPYIIRAGCRSKQEIGNLKPIIVKAIQDKTT